jgi:hypothetical protein
MKRRPTKPMKIKMLRNFDEFLIQLLQVVVDDDGHLAFAGDLREGGTMMLMVLVIKLTMPYHTYL